MFWDSHITGSKWNQIRVGLIRHVQALIVTASGRWQEQCLHGKVVFPWEQMKVIFPCMFVYLAYPSVVLHILMFVSLDDMYVFDIHTQVFWIAWQIEFLYSTLLHFTPFVIFLRAPLKGCGACSRALQSTTAWTSPWGTPQNWETATAIRTKHASFMSTSPSSNLGPSKS